MSNIVIRFNPAPLNIGTAFYATGISLEEPMTPTRRQVWAEIKDRCTASVAAQTKPFTIAVATTTYDDSFFGGFGAACCSHKDEWNPTTGANIAKGRAISNLLDTIMAQLKGEA